MTLGKEVRILKPPTKPGASLPVAWVFPNAYEIGMASLGYQLVWWLLEQDMDTSVSRVFTDCQESNWQQSELVGFTVSWELDYINVLNLLRQMNINWLAEERGDDEPIVFGGGPVLTANPEPFADFFDVILLGDAEVTVPAFLNAWKKTSHLKERAKRLEAMASVDGIYVPRFYKYRLTSPNGPIEAIESIGEAPATVKKQTFNAPDDYIVHSSMLAPDTTFGDTFLVEVVRSCPQECRFCLASYLTRPFRTADVENLVSVIDTALKYTNKVGLLGPSITEHPQFDSLAEKLIERPQIQISVPSVRADSLNPIILDMMHKLGQKSVTIALESGSERLRAIMKKNLSEAEIIHSVELIEKSGIKNIKFYGMVGLPGETEQDLIDTINLMKKLKKLHKQMHFVFGVSSFVPKAQTPFQWSGRDKQSKAKIEHLRKELSRIGIEVRPESHNWSDIQAMISRGDRRLTPLLIQVAESSGNLGAWRKAFRQLPANCPSEEYYVFRNIPYEETLPWSHIQQSGKTSMLLRHSEDAYERAQL